MPCNDRFGEHTRAANNPASYPNNAIGKHYSEFHQNCKSAKLEFTICRETIQYGSQENP